MSKKNRKPKPATQRVEVLADPAAMARIRKQICIAIAIFSFLLYAQSISFEYTYDDSAVIQENKIIKEGFKAIPDLMNSDYWYGFTGTKQGAIYRPASLIMFAVEWQLWPDNPMPGHFINVLLFALSCTLLFIFLTRLFPNNLLVALITALLYTVHPIHTEVVNNIKSRDEILCFLFSICAMLAYLRYYSTKDILSLVIGSLFFLLALLSKETAITFLVIIPLTLFVFRETNVRRLVYSGLSVAVITGVYLVLRQQISNHMPLAGSIAVIDNFLVNAANYNERLASAIYILLRYIGLLFIPHPLSSDYSYAQLELKTFTDPSVIFAVLLFGAAAIYSLITIRKKNVYAYCILFFFITISPVSNLLFLIGASMGERFLYIPSFSFCLLVSLVFVRIAKAAKHQARFASMGDLFKKNPMLLLLAALIVVVFTLKTFFRSSDWKNNLTLFSVDSKTSANSARAHYGYGTALMGSADSSEFVGPEQAEKYRQAKTEYETAISIYPEYANAYVGLGIFYKNELDYKNAVANMEKARFYTQHPRPNLYKDLGYVYLKNGQFDKAVAALDSFLLGDTANADILNNKGSALFGQKKYTEALAVYMRAIAMKPNDLEILKNIGKCHIYLKQYDQAEVYFKKILALEPGKSENYQFLGLTYQLMNDSTRGNPLIRQYEAMKAAEKNKLHILIVRTSKFF